MSTQAASRTESGRPAVARERRPCRAGRPGARGLGLVLIACLVWLWPSIAAAAARAIERISTRSEDGTTTILIAFQTKLRYVTHLPGREGARLFIHLRPVEDFSPNGAPIQRSEAQSWRPTAELPLTEVRYDGSLPTGPGLIVLFQRPVRYAVTGSRDDRSITITVEKPPAAAARVAPRPAAPAPPGAAPPPISPERLAQIDREARAAMTKGDLDRAVSLFTKLLEYPNHPYRQEAQELLGLARERKGQAAHAKAEYEKYLEAYPSGEGAVRVRQRLAALLTAQERPREKLREARRDVAGRKVETQLYGSFSQFYARQDRFTDQEGRVTDRSDMFTDLDLTARAFDDTYDVRAVFVGGHAFNLLAADRNNRSRISNLFIDARQRPLGLAMRVGRQTQSSGGVLGRFDGGLLTQRILPSVAVNFVGGYLVGSTTDLGIGMDRPFYGASVDLGRFADRWDFSFFAINQEAGGILDRRAVGMESRFTMAGRGSFFSLVDYDVSYRALNIALLTGNVTFADTTTVNLIVDYRRSPILTTTNGVQGQATSDVAALLQTVSEDQLRGFARDRTATSRSATLGVSHKLSDAVQVSGDVTVSKLSATEASGGIETVPGTGYELFYSTQLVASGLFMAKDISIFGIAFADHDQSNTASLTLNTRFPITRLLRINPRLRLDYRWMDADSSRKRIRVAPSVKLDYRLAKDTRLELEVGGEWTTERFVDVTDQATDFFATVGYRVDF